MKKNSEQIHVLSVTLLWLALVTTPLLASKSPKLQEQEGFFQTPSGEFVAVAAVFEGTPGEHLKMLNFSSGQQGELPLSKVPVGKRVAFKEEVITFYNGSTRLSGFIVRPKKRIPAPGVVIVHGGGPQSAEHSRAIAQWFAWNGIVALAYDKRGVGKSGGDWRSTSLHLLAGDALCGVRRLQQVSEVDKKKVGLFGFSQAGWVMAIASSISEEIRFLVPVVPSGINMEDQEIYSRQQLLKAKGFKPAEISEAVELMRLAFRAIREPSIRDKVRKDVSSSQPWNVERSRFFAIRRKPV